MTSTSTSTRPAFLFVHGAWHTPAGWDQVRGALEADGWHTDAVTLPSAVTGEPHEGRHPGIFDDARVIRRHLERLPAPAVLVGHSYGGAPLSQAAADPTGIAHLVYVASFVPDIGESVNSLIDRPETPENGVLPPMPDPAATYYGDLPAEEAAAHVEALVPQSQASLVERLTGAGWRTLPSTYIICENDQALPPALQEALAARAGNIERLKSDHSPFLSRPAELAALLTRIAENAA